MRPFAVIVTASFISLVLSFFYISRFMFAAACLMCAYGAILNSMHTSFKQHNDPSDFRHQAIKRKNCPVDSFCPTGRKSNSHFIVSVLFSMFSSVCSRIQLKGRCTMHEPNDPVYGCQASRQTRKKSLTNHLKRWPNKKRKKKKALLRVATQELPALLIWVQTLDQASTSSTMLARVMSRGLARTVDG